MKPETQLSRLDDNVLNDLNVLNDFLSQYTNTNLKNKKERQPEDLKNVDYQLNSLAKLLSNPQNQKLHDTIVKKERTPNYKGGTAYTIIDITETTLIVRREWTTRAELLVMIPEKLIYRIYNELTGELTWDYITADDTKEFNVFWRARNTNNQTQRTICDEISTSSRLLWRYMLFPDRKYTSSTYSSYTYPKVIFPFEQNWRPTKQEKITHLQNVAKLLKCQYILKGGHSQKLETYLTHPTSAIDLWLKIQPKTIDDKETYGLLHTLASFIAFRFNAWPNDNPITNPNILKNLMQATLLQAPGTWKMEQEFKSQVYKHIWQITKWAEYQDRLQTYEYVNLEFSHYLDIMQMAAKLNNNKLTNKYPTNWKTFEHKVRTIYNKVKRELEGQTKFNYPDSLFQLEHRTAETNREYDYFIKLPQTYYEVLDEASQLGHCVGGYTERIAKGETTVLLLRNKKSPNKSLGTMELKYNNHTRTWSITQAKGKYNSNLPIEVIAYIIQYATLKDITIKEQYFYNTHTAAALAQHLGEQHHEER